MDLSLPEPDFGAIGLAVEIECEYAAKLQYGPSNVKLALDVDERRRLGNDVDRSGLVLVGNDVHGNRTTIGRRAAVR